VLLDALGTLVELEPPAPRLAALLDLPPGERVYRALRAEMSYYREHAHEAVDAGSLAELRADCARLVSDELGLVVSAETLMQAISFRAFADSAPALRSLRGAGVSPVCVSNWDFALPDVLQQVGLLGLLDGVVTSAGAGARKPDAAIFEAGLAVAGCDAGEALHVGDTPAEDVAGARAAGIPVLLLCRPEAPCEAPPDVPVISSLSAISHHLRHGRHRER
jgi:putative hydrolase of the HAD superfamily